VRIAVDAALGRRDADLGEELDRTPAGRRGRQAGMGPERLDDLVADPVERVEARQGILEDHTDALAADPAHLVGGQVVDAAPRQPDLAAGDAAGRIDEADHGGAGHRLAGAGLADDAQDLAPGDVERDPVDRLEDAAPGDELDAQVADGEDGLGHGAFRSRAPLVLQAGRGRAREIPSSRPEREWPSAAAGPLSRGRGVALLRSRKNRRWSAQRLS
jgi:hypothetical protein